MKEMIRRMMTQGAEGVFRVTGDTSGTRVWGKRKRVEGIALANMIISGKYVVIDEA